MVEQNSPNVKQASKLEIESLSPFGSALYSSIHFLCTASLHQDYTVIVPAKNADISILFEDVESNFLWRDYREHHKRYSVPVDGALVVQCIEVWITVSKIEASVERDLIK